MIPQTSEYALRAVVHLAKTGGGPETAQSIGAATEVSVGYLQKVLRQLANGGILAAQRGLHGGFSLQRPPSRITVLEVLRCTDGAPRRITACPLGIEGHDRLCRLHRMLDTATAGVEDAFRSTTIADLLDAGGATGALCDRVGDEPVAS